MKNALALAMLSLTLVAVSLDTDAAKRFGGGNNIGKQRVTPSNTAAPGNAAAPATPGGTAAASTPAAPAPAAAPGALPAKPSFMGRWGGLLAGLGIGALLATMFGAQMGPVMGLLLLGLLIAAAAFMLVRLLAARRVPATANAGAPVQFAGIGSTVAPPSLESGEPTAAPRGPSALSPSEVEPFLRTAKTSFIRLQAANDSRDLADIRDYTTPEVYAEIAMQISERGEAPQKTEVVMLDAKLVDDVIEDDQAIASVHFSGLIRENDAPTPSPFDEIWHVRKNLRERNATWQIAGIQQAA
jgi:predicted lipid-binding transport protein (Tim44 family)